MNKLICLCSPRCEGVCHSPQMMTLREYTVKVPVDQALEQLMTDLICLEPLESVTGVHPFVKC